MHRNSLHIDIHSNTHTPPKSLLMKFKFIHCETHAENPDRLFFIYYSETNGKLCVCVCNYKILTKDCPILHEKFDESPTHESTIVAPI